jgi:hypothetical protein
LAKSNSPVRDRTVPKVADRLKMKHHQLLRAVNHGEVKVEKWGGVSWITEAEEARLGALLAEARKPVAGKSEQV